MKEKVAVVIPAFNAAATIDETLASVRAQSWDALEIIVVDDGSQDDTADRAAAHATADARIRLIRKVNGGVASARNLGIAEATAELIAPVDADDLWRPDKIERQMAVLADGGERMGLVYTQFAVIDARSHITLYGAPATIEGQVLRAMCLGNFVGNGSCPLIRKAALIEAGGYDPALRAAKAQGCEDLKLYFSIAERHHFGAVAAPLTGYRETAANMSSDGRQMLRSYDLVMEEKLRAYPQFAAEFAHGRARMIDWLLGRALRYGRREAVAALFAELRRQDPARARRRALALPITLLRDRLLRYERDLGPFLG